MIANLREAKSSLSKYVQMAADGEDVLITVHGEPKARLVSAAPVEKKIGSKEDWADELRRSAAAALQGEPISTPQQYWDDVRGDRI